jgi:hypothetical protein
MANTICLWYDKDAEDARWIVPTALSGNVSA